MTHEEFVARVVDFVAGPCGRRDRAVEARYLAQRLWSEMQPGPTIDLRDAAQPAAAALAGATL